MKQSKDRPHPGVLWLSWLLLFAGWEAATAATPDLAGVYDITGGFRGPDPGLGELKPLNNHGDEATKRLVPWARAKMEASADYSAIDDYGAVCGPTGFFRHPTTVVGYMVLQSPTQIWLVSMDLGQVGVRRVYLTDKHPRTLRPSWNGHSIGHFEGDTLVVDTVGFNDKSWLGSELQPHTEELHVIEYIKTVKDGRYLEIRSVIDDRKALTGPYTYTRYYKRVDKPFEAVESGCNQEAEEQEIWAYMRDEAIKQFDINRQNSQSTGEKTQ
ncbi:MAG: hypothetical protein QM696_07085 [Steroidobacteraceae bacterium]